MRLLILIISILVFLLPAPAEDLIFFADDHYKSVGAPQLEASVANPVVDSGSDAVLRIALANSGRVEELIPTQENGSDEDAAAEMAEEMHCVDALNISARLYSTGPISIVSGPYSVASLPGGSVAQMEFNISASGASGWYELPLALDYEHQVDVTVSNSSVSPLYQPDNTRQSIRIFIQGQEGLGIVDVRSKLYPGGNGTILAAIRNGGSEVLHNCTARLITAPPFMTASNAFLGDLAPNQIAVAQFAADVEENASLRDYRLACELSYNEGSAMLSLPVTIVRTSYSLIIYALMLATLIILSSGIFVWKKYSRRPLRRRKSW